MNSKYIKQKQIEERVAQKMKLQKSKGTSSLTPIQFDFQKQISDAFTISTSEENKPENQYQQQMTKIQKSLDNFNLENQDINKDNIDQYFEKILKQENQENLSSQKNTENKACGQDLINKAKEIVKKNKTTTRFKYKPTQEKESMFMTGINMCGEEESAKNQVEPESEEVQSKPPEFDEEGFVKNLIQEERQGEDDLAELRRMIKRTKGRINDFAQDVHGLKNSVSEVNVQFKSLGYGVSEDALYDMDQQMSEDIPFGNKVQLFKKNGTLQKVNGIQKQNKTKQLQLKDRPPKSNSNQNNAKVLQYQSKTKSINSQCKPNYLKSSDRNNLKKTIDTKDIYNND